MLDDVDDDGDDDDDDDDDDDNDDDDDDDGGGDCGVMSHLVTLCHNVVNGVSVALCKIKLNRNYVCIDKAIIGGCQ